MSTLAQWLARKTWAAMLWLMRRPWMRRLQAAWLRAVPERSRERVWQSHLAQNRFARRWGYPALAFMYLLLLASILVTISYFGLLALIDSGAVRTR